MVRQATVLLSIIAACTAVAARAAPALQGEVEIEAASRVERNAGVWLDGQYVGSVSELNGRGRLVLVPGEHQLLFKLVGYDDVASTLAVEPGSRHRHRVAMTPSAGARYPDKNSTARLRIDVKPEVAAIFINDSFVGRTDRFGSRAGVRMSPGTYRVTIALPGYEPFKSELTLAAGQTYEIATKLAKGRLADQATELAFGAPIAPER